MFPKKTVRLIDGRDREILRLLHNSNREMSGHQIAKRIGLSSPAIKPRLEGLHSQGILKKVSQGENRNFERMFNNKNMKISAPSKILWGLDIRKKRK